MRGCMHTGGQLDNPCPLALKTEWKSCKLFDEFVQLRTLGHSHPIYATPPSMQLWVHSREVLNVIHDRVGRDLGAPQLS